MDRKVWYLFFLIVIGCSVSVNYVNKSDDAKIGVDQEPTISQEAELDLFSKDSIQQIQKDKKKDSIKGKIKDTIKR